MIITKISCVRCKHDLVRVSQNGSLTCMECDGYNFNAYHHKSNDITNFKKKLKTLKANNFDEIISELAVDFDAIINN